MLSHINIAKRVTVKLSMNIWEQKVLPRFRLMIYLPFSDISWLFWMCSIVYFLKARLKWWHSLWSVLFTFCSSIFVQCPTTIVPFFGDQPFWGDRVHARGVGPAPIPVDQFSLPKLVEAINFMLDSKVFFLSAMRTSSCECLVHIRRENCMHTPRKIQNCVYIYHVNFIFACVSLGFAVNGNLSAAKYQ